MKNVFYHSAVTFLPTQRGGSMVMYKDYTFSYRNGKRLLVCSSIASKKCKAKLRMDKTGQIIVVDEAIHNHPPPMFHKAADGTYIKLS